MVTKVLGLHSWIRIIMPLTDVQEERDDITDAFRAYAAKEGAPSDKYGIRVHWAKIELPKKEEDEKRREYVEKRYPVNAGR